MASHVETQPQKRTALWWAGRRPQSPPAGLPTPLPSRAVGDDLATMAAGEQHAVRVRWIGLAVGCIASPFLLRGGQVLALWAFCVFAAVYNVVLTLYVIPRRPRWLLNGYATSLGDIVLASGAVFFTGGLRSELYLAYFLVAVASAVRFGNRTARVATAAVVAAYLSIVALTPGDLTRGALGLVLIRMGFMAATAFFAGFVADRARAAERGLHEAYDNTLAALSAALDQRDTATEGHSRRVTAYARILGEAIGLEGQDLAALARGALLHDIGKIGVPDRILRKTGPLSPREHGVVRSHPTTGGRILEGIPFLQDALAVVLHHHECWDGSGYPDGQRGEEISLLARVFAIVDCFDAMTSDRPYRGALSYAEAVTEIRRCSGVQFDPEIVRAFAAIPQAVWVAAVQDTAEVEPATVAAATTVGQG